MTVYYLILIAYTRQYAAGVSLITCSERVSLRDFLSEDQIIYYLCRVVIANGQSSFRNKKSWQKNVTSSAWRLMVDVPAPGTASLLEVVHLQLTIRRLMALQIVGQYQETPKLFCFKTPHVLRFDDLISAGGEMPQIHQQHTHELVPLMKFQLHRAGLHVHVVFVDPDNTSPQDVPGYGSALDHEQVWDRPLIVVAEAPTTSPMETRSAVRDHTRVAQHHPHHCQARYRPSLLPAMVPQNQHGVEDGSVRPRMARTDRTSV